MQSFNKKIHVVSLGVGDVNTLTPAANQALKTAAIVIGAAHHLQTVSGLLNANIETVLFPSPFSKLKQILEQYKNKNITVLASGDALFYGVGKYLSENFKQDALVFHPNVSSMQVAFHRIGLPWQDAVIHSLHGRALSTLHSRLQNGLLIGLFTDEISTPTVIAEYLIEQGFSQSEMWLCKSLGSDKENVAHYKANELKQTKFEPLTICIIKCVGQNQCLPGVPGLADECFATGSEPGKGMISKREVRLSILSLMECHPNDVAWDIGAGCGSVSIEWALQSKQAVIYAIENNTQRMEFLKLNNQQLGTERIVKPVLGTAPECCHDLPQPDVVFIGGNGGNLLALLEYAWSALNSGGRLVASAVMPNSITALYDFADRYKLQKGELIQMQVSKTNSLSRVNQLNELKPVTLLKVVKGDTE